MAATVGRTQIFRDAIDAFISARREAKLKSKEGDASDLAARYDYGSWLTDAARRVSQIQAVTHVPKATHPYARGTSLHVPPRSLPSRSEIGTHVLGDDFAVDVVGNAAALDVFKFLGIEVEGCRLLDWMQAGDADLQAALHPDASVAAAWMKAFSNLVRDGGDPSSDALAKQLYWLVGADPADDAGYHLLQPMFSSSLAQAVHTEIQEARFGDANKQARQSRRDKKPHTTPNREYLNLAVRKLGGTKPQNVSQLNSERRGMNYLLASLPPVWRRQQAAGLLGAESALDRFRYGGGEVQKLMRALTDLLLSEPEKNMATRDRREAIEQALGAQLQVFAAGVHSTMEPGWSRNPDCRLPLCEKIWLDPERAELPMHEGHEEEDQDFRMAFERGVWPDEIASRFAHWVNGQLREAGLVTVGDVEFRHWARQAILDAAWPVPTQRRGSSGGLA